MHQNLKVIFLFTLYALITPTYAQEQFTHTLKYDSLTGSPKASLNNLEWLPGHWRGEGLGGIIEEIWTPPLGGSMMCAFKLVVNGRVVFYELITITEENETLILKLKHFHADLRGWEERDKTVDFRLVKIMDNKVCFDGFTLEKINDSGMNSYVVLQQKDGKKAEVRFSYNRLN